MTDPSSSRAPYVAALGWRVFNRLYDPLIHATLPERAIKSALIEQAALQPGQRILDLGCGTGTLLLMVARAAPACRVAGVDGDRGILGLAVEKSRRTNRPLAFVNAFAQELPFAPSSFDRVLTTLMLHHLTPDDRRFALREVHRVLTPRGVLHIADWGQPHTAVMRLLARSVGFADAFHRVRDNLEGRIPALCLDAGFASASEGRRWPTIFGTLSLYAAAKGA